MDYFQSSNLSDSKEQRKNYTATYFIQFNEDIKTERDPSGLKFDLFGPKGLRKEK